MVDTSSSFKLTLIRGDITKQEVDAIVNAANDGLAHGAGLAAAIVKAGGSIINDESREYVKQNGRLKTSGNAVTSPGNLPCNFLIHSVGPYYHEEGKNISICELYDCMTKTLDRANNELGCTSIAFPAISAGLYGFPLDLCAHTMLEALENDLSEKYNSAQLGLKDIRIVIIDEPSFLGVRREFFKRYPTSKDPKTGQQASLADKSDLWIRVPFQPATEQTGSAFIAEARKQAADEQVILDALKDQQMKDVEEGKDSGLQIECEYCDQKILFDFMMQHIEFECTKAAGGGRGSQITCRNCQRKVEASKIQWHNSNDCGNIKCRVCGTMISKSQLDDHNMAHQKYFNNVNKYMRQQLEGRGPRGPPGRDIAILPHPKPIFTGPSNVFPPPRHGAGPAKKGMPMKLEDFPKTSFDHSHVPPGVKEGEKVECQVCMMNFHQGDPILTMTCMHYYHLSCASDWLVKHTKCPICGTVQVIDEQYQ